MKLNLLQSLILLILLCAAPQAFGTDEPLSCADRSIVAHAVRTTEDVQAFVQCAQELVQEAGTAEAYRAFHEDDRWRSPEIYVFVFELIPSAAEAKFFVHPIQPHREGAPWGTLSDRFGDDIIREGVRVVQTNGSGWWYYAFTNPSTGNTEPKVSFLMPVDWNGAQAVIGAGIYLRDLPGSCNSDDVNAALLFAAPSDQRLQAFVRCAAMGLESQGYFATRALSSDPRWRSQSIYLFGLDTYGNPLFSGDPYSQEYGLLAPELNDHLDGPFGGRDVVSVGNAFGETFLYYSTRNPATGMP